MESRKDIEEAVERIRNHEGDYMMDVEALAEMAEDSLSTPPRYVISNANGEYRVLDSHQNYLAVAEFYGTPSNPSIREIVDFMNTRDKGILL